MDNPTLADIFRTLGSQDAKLDNLKETQDKNHFAVMEEINDIKENCKNQCSSNTYGREAREQRGEEREIRGEDREIRADISSAEIREAATVLKFWNMIPAFMRYGIVFSGACGLVIGVVLFLLFRTQHPAASVIH